jgi:hypothetical protein
MSNREGDPVKNQFESVVKDTMSSSSGPGSPVLGEVEKLGGEDNPAQNEEANRQPGFIVRAWRRYGTIFLHCLIWLAFTA